MQRNTQFNTYSLGNLHVCQVCASFQCPYCLYYNAAVRSVPTSRHGNALVAFLAFVVWFLATVVNAKHS